ncbi:MAG TPA: hypothetical protein PKD84_01170 [Propionicimonas sp.]|nr:hypothetical protein [Propionicimonas sp.]
MLGSSVLGAVSGLFGGVVGSVVGRAVGKAAGFVLKGFDRGRVVRIVEQVFGLGDNTGRTAAKGAAEVPDALVLARGGTNTAERFASGSGVVGNADGTLSGVSVNSGRTVEEAAQGIPHKQIGVTTAGDVRRAGGTVTPDPLPDNPGHCLLSGCSADVFSQLFTPTIKNPGL